MGSNEKQSMKAGVVNVGGGAEEEEEEEEEEDEEEDSVAVNDDSGAVVVVVTSSLGGSIANTPNVCPCVLLAYAEYDDAITACNTMTARRRACASGRDEESTCDAVRP